MDENEKIAKKKEPTTGELMAKEIISKYKPKTVADMQDALMVRNQLMVNSKFQSVMQKYENLI